MTVEIRHIDESRGTELGDIPPSEIQPLINLLKNGIPVYHYDVLPDNTYEGCAYSTHQLIRYDNDNFVFEIIVE